MTTITQTMKFRQALVEYSLKHGITKAAIRYKVNRQYVYRWRKRYDGTVQSLADKSGLLRILCKVQTRVKQMLAGRGVSLLFNITETRQKIKP